MSDGDAILAQILANPEDDTARLVYADWLQENGQGERAEFIRTQIAFENTENEADAFELDERAWRLWQANYAKWEGVPGLSNWITRRSLCRGFIESVTCSAADWLAHADAILARHPVTAVRLTTWLHCANVEGGRVWLSPRDQKERMVRNEAGLFIREERTVADAAALLADLTPLIAARPRAQGLGHRVAWAGAHLRHIWPRITFTMPDLAPGARVG